MDGGAWWATLVHGVAKSRTQLNNFTHFHLNISNLKKGSRLEKGNVCC